VGEKKTAACNYAYQECKRTGKVCYRLKGKKIMSVADMGDLAKSCEVRGDPLPKEEYWAVLRSQRRIKSQPYARYP